jgi:ketosteroid isomerase-like protein
MCSTEHAASGRAPRVVDSPPMRCATRFATSLLAVPLVCLLGCGSPSASQAEADVTGVIESFYGAMKRGDAAAAMALIAPDAVFVESGKLETRDEYEKNHLPADIGFEKQVSGKRSPVKVTVKGDTAWLIATTEYAGTFDGQDVDFVSAQLAVLSLESGAWRIRSIHWSSRRR